MKKLYVFAMTLVIWTGVMAQESEFTNMMRELYREEFKAVMYENMNLTEAQEVVFTPIFNDFLLELRSVMDNKLATQAKFAKYFDGMTDEQVKEILSEVSKNGRSLDKTIFKYTKKVGKALDPQTAFRFFLIVEKVNNALEYSTIQALPLVKN